MYATGGKSKKLENKAEPIFGVPQVAEKFTKYYFTIKDDSLSVRQTKITVTRVVRRTVWYDETMEDGTREKFRFVKEGTEFDGDVVSSPFGLSIMTSKGAVYAKKQIMAYLDDRVRVYEEELAKAVKRRNMVEEAIRLMEANDEAC